jgi:GT2 family glycosyltransferase
VGEGELRCIVVDNGSSDGTHEAVGSAFPDAQVVRHSKNVGFGQAVNEGARAGRGAYVLILNSDVVARPGAVGRLVAYLECNESCAVVAGQLVHEGSDQPQVGFAIRGFPSLAGQVALLTGLERYWPHNPVSLRQSFLDFDYGRTQEIHAQPAGACLMCRRDDFEAVGGFDETFYYWFEDVDLVHRLAARGTIAYVHEAVFEHLGAATFGQWDRPAVVVARYHGLLRYFDKHHPGREALALRGVVALLAALRAVPLMLVDRRLARAYARVVALALGSQ